MSQMNLKPKMGKLGLVRQSKLQTFTEFTEIQYLMRIGELKLINMQKFI